MKPGSSARIPVQVTDRGKIVAVLGSPKLFNCTKRPKRGLPKEYLEFIQTLPRTDLVKELKEEHSKR